MISVSRGRCGLRKTEKIFSANNEQGTIKRGEKWFPEKLLKKIDLKNFKPLYTNKKVQLQLDFLISPAVDGLFLISVSRGRCGLRKTEKIFSANNEQGTIKRGEKWFPEKLLKKIYLENLKPLYTNKKVQLQLDFFD